MKINGKSKGQKEKSKENFQSRSEAKDARDSLSRPRLSNFVAFAFHQSI
jgi:hypothetical protein